MQGALTGHRRRHSRLSRRVAPEVTPHPFRDGWKKRRRGTPSPLGRGLYFRLWHAPPHGNARKAEGHFKWQMAKFNWAEVLLRKKPCQGSLIRKSAQLGGPEPFNPSLTLPSFWLNRGGGTVDCRHDGLASSILASFARVDGGPHHHCFSRSHDVQQQAGCSNGFPDWTDERRRA